MSWVQQESEPGECPKWDGRCACGCGHDDAPEVPTWRTWSRGDQRVRELTQHIEFQRAQLDKLKTDAAARDQRDAELGAHVRALLALIYDGVLVGTVTTEEDPEEEAHDILELLEALEGYVGFDSEGEA